MKPIRYRGRYPEAEEDLRDRGLLWHGRYPTQKPIYLVKKDGVDIFIKFQRMDPIHFSKNSSLILKAALEEASRYESIPSSVRFAEFVVDIWDKSKHRKPIERTFTTEYNPDSDIMVYGITGWGGTFLVDKVDNILDIPKRYAEKMRSPTYKVKLLRIGIRIPKGELVTA